MSMIMKWKWDGFTNIRYESIAKYEKYGKQFTQAYSAAELTPEERKAYIKLQEKAQPRIQELKELGLYP